MKKTLLTITILIVIAILAWFGYTFIAHGGWPNAGPTGDQLPLHIEYVVPADGQVVGDSQGFCVHINYLAGLGLGYEPQQRIRYYLDGFNVTKHVRDLTVLEYGYPAPEGEPCYRRDKPLSTGWHTVKIVYTDIGEHEFSYLWRFQIVETGE
jgi:hypothetical protein